MTHYICVTCGTQFAVTDNPPAHCPICEDERQYVGWQGQQRTMLATLQSDHHNEIREVEPYAFDRLHGAWWDRVVMQDGKSAVHRSAERYVRTITG